MSNKEKKELKAQAKAFIKERKGYTTKDERRAYRLALRERKKAWRASLAGMDEAGRSAAVKKARRFWAEVYKKELLILAAFVLLCAAALIIFL